MSIKTPEELAAMRRVGRLVAEVLADLRREVIPGVTTAQLDARAATLFARAGATSAPMTTYDFPGTICISVNEEVVHGVPGARRLREGDLVTLDVTPELDGFFADAAVTVPVGRPRPAARRLLRVADACLDAAMAATVQARPLREIGRATEQTAHAAGARCFPELRGHGIGRGLHEPPTVPNVDVPTLRRPLNAGLVLAVEPMVTFGRPELVTGEDGWTIATADGSLSVHVEHTVVVSGPRPEILTTA